MEEKEEESEVSFPTVCALVIGGAIAIPIALVIGAILLLGAWDKPSYK